MKAQEENKREPFKRKVFLDKLYKIIKSFNKDEDSTEILRIGLSLPSSQDNVSAFIVKYTSMVTKYDKITKQVIYSERTSEDIARNFISKAVVSKEHFIPKNPLEGVMGTDAAENLAPECSGCNNARHSTQLYKWVELNPNMKENAQKYIDFVIEKINTGKIKNFSWYPKNFAKNLKEQSNGLINLDISKLKSSTSD